jgi:hypothetical protein
MLGTPSPYPSPQIKNERVAAVSIDYTAPDGKKKTIMISPATAQSALRSAEADVSAATTLARVNSAKRHENQHRAELAEYAKLKTTLKSVDAMIDAARDSLAAALDDEAKSKEILTRVETESRPALQGVQSELERLGREPPAAAQPAGTPAAAPAAADGGPVPPELTAALVAADPNKYIGKKVSWFGSMLGAEIRIEAGKSATTNCWTSRKGDGKPEGAIFLTDEGRWSPAASTANSFKELFHVVGVVKGVSTITLEGRQITAVFLENVAVELVK